MHPPCPSGSLSLSQLLDRHQQRREAGLPTVSVLCGPAGSAVDEARRWAERVRRPMLSLSHTRYERILESWVDFVSAGRDLGQEAVAWWARNSSGIRGDLLSRWTRITPHELAAYLDANPVHDPSGSRRCAWAVCRWLLEQAVCGASITGFDLMARRGEVFPGCDEVEAFEQVVSALRAWIAPEHDPILLLVRGPEAKGREPSTWFDTVAQSLSRLAICQPSLPLLLAAETDQLEEFARSAPESRAKALIRAGVISVRGVDEGGIRQRLESETPGEIARLAGSVRRLTRDGASESLVELFLDAAGAGAAPQGSVVKPPGKPNDPARSAAERFLFERLGSLPATAGLFELNVALDFRFGPTRAMEVDLCARALKIAVEVDGYYHFLEADAYRRDRRKDLELQRRGYLVVRVLAEDVVARLEDVLNLILDAVAERGGHPQ